MARWCELRRKRLARVSNGRFPDESAAYVASKLPPLLVSLAKDRACERSASVRVTPPMELVESQSPINGEYMSYFSKYWFSFVPVGRVYETGVGVGVALPPSMREAKQRHCCEGAL